MTDPNNLEPKLLKMERDIASANENSEQARGQAAAAFSLASAHTKTLNALRQTQLDHHREFTDFRAEMVRFRAETQANFARVDDNFAKVESKMTEFAVGQLHITRLLESISEK